MHISPQKLKLVLFHTLLGSSCTKPLTTGMRAAAATALTSSSKSCRPSVIAGSTRGSKTAIKSFDTKEKMKISMCVYSIRKRDNNENICVQSEKSFLSKYNTSCSPQFTFMATCYSNQIQCRILLFLFKTHHMHSDRDGVPDEQPRYT